MTKYKADRLCPASILKIIGFSKNHIFDRLPQSFVP